MRPVGEDLDRLEPVGGDLHAGDPAQPLVVVEVRRYGELQGAHAGSGVHGEHLSIEDSDPNPEFRSEFGTRSSRSL